MRRKYAVTATPKRHLHECPIDLGTYRWLWVARLRVEHWLRDGLLHASTQYVTVAIGSKTILTYRPDFGGGWTITKGES